MLNKYFTKKSNLDKNSKIYSTYIYRKYNIIYFDFII